MTAAREFREFAGRLGYELPTTIEPNRFFRFSTSGRKNKNDDAGWGILFADGQGGILGDWRTGERQVWQAKRDHPMTAPEYRDWQNRIERERTAAQAQLEQEQADAAARAAEIWETSRLASADHPYLARKRVPPYGLRVYEGPNLVIRDMDCRGALVMALRNAAGDIQSLEFISADGEKRFLPRASYKGACFPIGEPGDMLVIAEGYATGASIHKATNFPVQIAAAAGNLIDVAKALRSKLPDGKLILCADNDLRADGKPNAGLEAATKAAQAVGGLVAIPELDGRKCDFNDVALERGDETVRRVIVNARAPAAQVPTSTANTSEAKEWPEPLNEAAFCGLAGEIVRTIESQTEADPAAILIQALIAFGAAVGRGPHVRVEGDQHHSNLFALIVGETSKARKGTSWGRVREIFSRVPEWPRVVDGLSSGEGLKWAVRDPITKLERDKKTGLMQEIETDPGIVDKRLLVVEPEFAQVLRQGVRAGNTLSATIRSAWDSGNLRTLTRNDPITATGAHISIIGHITADELRAELTAIETGNGFANRFLFTCAKRSRALPFGGDPISPEVLESFANRIGKAVDNARRLGEVGMTVAARDAWIAIYERLSDGYPGLFGAVTGRAEAQCLRLALVFALMDGAKAIDLPHLLAAIAVWERAAASARFIFGNALGDPIADQALDALKAARPNSITRTGISALFGRHQTAERIGTALALLERLGLARRGSVPTEGAPAEHWWAA